MIHLTLKILLVILSFLYAVHLIVKTTHPPAKDLKLGVSFSASYTESLGINWKDAYQALLDDLKIKHLRLSSPWDQIQPEPNRFDFSTLDYLLEEAKKRQARVLLVVGVKQPRWPECHIPSWVISLSSEEEEKLALEATSKVIERYRQDSNIWGYQVENEPFVDFGDACISNQKSFVEKEVQLVRKLDPTRPIILTHAGEGSLPITPMRLSDIYGTTLYRKVNDPLLGDVKFIFPSSYYSLKSTLTRRIFASSNQKTILSELQAEPWSTRPLTKTPISHQIKNFPPQDISDNLNLAKQTGFDEIYLWGVEWWYWMKLNGHPEYWEVAKTAFKDNF